MRPKADHWAGESFDRLFDAPAPAGWKSGHVDLDAGFRHLTMTVIYVGGPYAVGGAVPQYGVGSEELVGCTWCSSIRPGNGDGHAGAERSRGCRSWVWAYCSVAQTACGTLSGGASLENIAKTPWARCQDPTEKTARTHRSATRRKRLGRFRRRHWRDCQK